MTKVIVRKPIKRIEIELIGVNVNADKCGIRVNDEVKWIDVGNKAIVGGVQIRVFDAFLVHTEKKDRDVCEVIIGGTVLNLMPRPQRP